MTMTKTALPPRSAIAKEHTWNKESVFATPADWEAACAEVLALLPGVQQFQGRLAEGPATLVDYVETAAVFIRKVMKVMFYANMSASVDNNDTQAQAMTGKALGILGQALASVAFGEPELLAIGQDTLLRWADQEPRLSIYRHYIDDLFRRQQHVRSAEVEQIMGLVADPFAAVENTFEILTSSEMKFAPAVSSAGVEVEVGQGSIDTLLDSADRSLRRTGWESYTDTYLAFKNTLASNLIASIKQSIFQARVRGYESSLAASLFDNNIPQAVFDNLLDTYKKNIPTWHKYWRVRRKVLGYDSLHPYDIWAPLTTEQPHVPFAQAVEWISAGMKPLGEDYVGTLRAGCLEQRWVDIYPNVGKRAGAFSYGSYDTYPFIMMSYDDNMGAMSTLAHELGHSMHSYYTRKHQPFIYGNYSLFAAEVASNFNQALTRAHLMQTNDDPAFQVSIISEAMSNFHRYFFIMPTLARFEREIHARVERGQGVTADDMNALMADLFEEGYGGEMVVDRDRVGITWATFGHLYNSFYVYQYATGISAAHALADKILAGDQDAVRRYREFLNAGSSMYPLDALKHAGADMTRPDAVETTFGVLASMVDRLEAITGV